MKFKISFCTVSMNRLYHLRETLSTNIKDNLDYPNIEFLILDYNSKDGLQSWIKKEMRQYIDQGILTYLRTKDPQFFHMSHSKNVAFKHANGDILVNLDADNYAGKGFASYVNSVFNQKENIFLLAPNINEVGGKVCLKKSDFMAVKGFDEQISGWGYEDTDLYYRLAVYGLHPHFFTNSDFHRFITHDNVHRVNNQKNYTNLNSIYGIIKKSWAELILLYQDTSFERGTVYFISSPEYENLFKNDIPNDSGPLCMLKQTEWIKGNWRKNESQIELLHAPNDHVSLVDHNSWQPIPKSINNHEVKKLANPKMINTALLVNTLTKNYKRFRDNYFSKSIIVNEEFGVVNLASSNECS